VNITEIVLLEKKLLDLGVGRNAFSLPDEAARDESYVLGSNGRKWTVYYSERGERVTEKAYASLEEAEQDFTTRLINDPTTRK
jgi:hypothetical protein